MTVYLYRDRAHIVSYPSFLLSSDQVETIGDAYMCASGLPQRNTYHHTEIAKMTISIMKVVDKFKIRHRPHRKLQLRAGIHSGTHHLKINTLWLILYSLMLELLCVILYAEIQMVHILYWSVKSCFFALYRPLCSGCHR